MPVRKVSNRGGNTIGKFPSLKMQRMVAYESLIEKDFIYVLDYEPDVTWFEEQPLTITYEHEGKTRRYTPDFHVVRGGQHWLVECKPEKFVDKEENQRKFNAAESWCAERGWVFCVVTAQDLRQGQRLENIKLMSPYARHPALPPLRSAIYRVLASSGEPLALYEVARQIPDYGLDAVVPSLLHMAYFGEVCIPLEDAELSIQTTVRL
jgi:hypothetical protein